MIDQTTSVQAVIILNRLLGTSKKYFQTQSSIEFSAAKAALGMQMSVNQSVRHAYLL